MHLLFKMCLTVVAQSCTEHFWANQSLIGAQCEKNQSYSYFEHNIMRWRIGHFLPDLSIFLIRTTNLRGPNCVRGVFLICGWSARIMQTKPNRRKEQNSNEDFASSTVWTSLSPHAAHSQICSCLINQMPTYLHFVLPIFAPSNRKVHNKLIND